MAVPTPDELHKYLAEEIGPFLDILRRGLPDVPRETKE